jgi:hypothetical protein
MTQEEKKQKKKIKDGLCMIVGATISLPKNKGRK